MRKVLLFCLLLSSTLCFAQSSKVTLKTGTIVELEAAETVYARNAQEGDLVKFRVIGEIKVDGKTVVPVGTMAEARVTEAKKSSLAGTKGRLAMDITNLVMPDGTKVPLIGKCTVNGKNRTPLAVITGCFFTPCFLIPGTKAVLTEGYYTKASVYTNTEVTVE